MKYAIRIPANDSLERDIAELLTRPVEDRVTSQWSGTKFLTQAASWKTARRVVAKVEHHPGELFPRVGFIVTNLTLPIGRWYGFTTSAGRRSNGSKKASKR